MSLLTLFTAILSFIGVSVPDEGRDMYDAFVNKLANSFVSVSYEYETEISGVKVVGEGNLFLQGRCYRYDADGLTVCSDSRSIWIADQAAREMVIEPVDESSLAVNPATLLVNLAGAFTVKSTKKAGDGEDGSFFGLIFIRKRRQKKPRWDWGAACSAPPRFAVRFRCWSFSHSSRR